MGSARLADFCWPQLAIVCTGPGALQLDPGGGGEEGGGGGEDYVFLSEPATTEMYTLHIVGQRQRCMRGSFMTWRMIARSKLIWPRNIRTK